MPALSKGGHPGKCGAMDRRKVMEAWIGDVTANGLWREAEHKALRIFATGLKCEGVRDARDELAYFLCIFSGGLADIHDFKRLMFGKGAGFSPSRVSEASGLNR